jgi:hypothetical protein
LDKPPKLMKTGRGIPSKEAELFLWKPGGQHSMSEALSRRKARKFPSSGIASAQRQ